MKVAVSSTGMDLNSQVDPRFGRCTCFIIVETDDMSFEAFDNENISLSGGAGIQSGSFVASKGAKAVLTGKCGPKAMQTLVAAEVEVFTGYSGTVREAVERFKQGESIPTTEANAPPKSGVSETGMMGDGRDMSGTGRGMGMGGGRGGGTGRGMGMGGGRGGGTGRGMGMGGGSGSGRGRGMGTGMPATDQKNTNAPSKAEALELLKKQAEELKKQMDDIESKISGLD